MVAAAPITTRDRNGIEAGPGIARIVLRIAGVAALATIAVILLGSSQASASECESDDEASDCTAQPEVAQQGQGDEDEGLPANDAGAPSNAVPPTTADPSAETFEDGPGAASSPGGVMAPTPVPSNMALVAGQDGPAPVEEIDRPTQQASPSVAASSSSVPPVGTSSGTAAAEDADAAVISSATHSPPPASLPAPEGEVVPAPPHQAPGPVEQELGWPGTGGLAEEAAGASHPDANQTVPAESMPEGVADIVATGQAALPDEVAAGVDEVSSSVPVPALAPLLSPTSSTLAPATSTVDSLTTPVTEPVTDALDPVVRDLKPTVNDVTDTVAGTTQGVAPDVPVVHIPIVEPQLPGSGPSSPGSGTNGSGGQNGAGGSDDNTAVDEQPFLDLFPGPNWNVSEVPGGGVPNSPSAPPPQSGGTDFDGQSNNFDDVTRTQVEQTDHGSSQDDTGHDSEQDGVPAPVPNQIPATPATPSSHGGSSGSAGSGSDLGQADLDAHRLPGTTHVGAASPEVWRLPGSPSFEPGHSPD